MLLVRCLSLLKNAPGRRLAGLLGMGLGLLLCSASDSLAAPDDLVNHWISVQTNVLTWSADAVQTRAFKTLAMPLVSTGKVWVATPDRFRWELGQPPQTIALRRAEELSIVYPRLKRIEKYSLKAESNGPWKDALALIEASFPRSKAEVDARFRIQSVRFTNEVVVLDLAPRSAAARKFVNGIEIGLRTNDMIVVSTTMRFSDGSMMRNDFTNIRINEMLDPGLFRYEDTAGFTISEPAGR